ncbi:MAG TPA: SDR family oxidoreductase [Flavobacteriaceae bacterium]|nr:SDR family oxidoreductase [Flavobacteriaceae bacterium]
MKILVTGGTGYIGKRIIPQLLEQNHTVICTVRDKKRIANAFKGLDNLSFIEVDFLKEETLHNIPNEIDVAYYLIHSMSSSNKFEEMELKCAENFKKRIDNTSTKQVIYLSGIVNDNELSTHLKSRFQVEKTLKSNQYGLTTFRAGIIVGSGSSSFEIIRDLVEKLPLMITPKWVNTKTQPISIKNVLQYLTSAVGNEDLFNKSFDIYGPEVLTYKQMMLQYAEVRNLKRYIFTVPVMSPRLSSYWLYFITSTSYKLAVNLVNSMKVEVIAKSNNLAEKLDIKPISYKQSVDNALSAINDFKIISSWKDAVSSRNFKNKIDTYINVPEFGVFTDFKKRKVENETEIINKIWAIGGDTGWYYGNLLWDIRGFMDQMVGGAGLRRGRRHPTQLNVGDSLDFWRVLYANKKEKRLLLYAEMKLPGEAWLEFKIVDNYLYQKATFRPHGLLGRLYWYAVLPFHYFVFNGMINNIVNK